jgi:two-component system, OmpR family, response regulator
MLRLEGWQVATATDARTALQAQQQLLPDVAILDIRLPDADGVQLLTELRKVQPELCVLFLTSRTSIEERIAGLRAGADDYVTKPFSFQEVLVRLQGLVRRSGLTSSTSLALLQVGDLVLDPATREVRRGGRSIELTATEFELLKLLMVNAGRVVSKSEILEGVWGQGFAVQGHIVELYISYLRRKVDAGFPPMIRTVRSVGYLLRSSEL